MEIYYCKTYLFYRFNIFIPKLSTKISYKTNNYCIFVPKLKQPNV